MSDKRAQRQDPIEKISQIEKFRETARELATDESESNFDDVLRRIAKPDPAQANATKTDSTRSRKT